MNVIAGRCDTLRVSEPRYRGRLAPSPTGRIHFGTARTSLVAWLRARAAGGTLVMRIEDLDPPRVVPGAADAMLEDLRWLGLDWDEGPDTDGPHAPYAQSRRGDRYKQALAQLAAAGHTFECSCTRKEVAAASSAPHGDLGPRYPGTCRHGATHPERPRSLRFRMDAPGASFDDVVHGAVPPSPPDDFVVRRSDGLYAYQLAVVIDDIAMGITEVVRGDDLLSSTPRQLALYDALGSTPPAFLHVPLVLGPDGARLSKRHGHIAIADYRDAGHSPQRVVGALAHTLGLAQAGEAITPHALIQRFDLTVLPREPTTLNDALWVG